MSQHNTHGEGIVDVSVGALCSIGSAFVTHGGELLMAILMGAFGTIGSIAVRVLYKRIFKKHVEK